MKKNVLDVLIFLFENDMFGADETECDQETLALELRQAGFNRTVIGLAFDWLENLALLCENNPPDQIDIDRAAIRHYCVAEQARLDTEARGLLLKLEQCGALNNVSREMVIDQLMALDDNDIEPNHVKWVTLMVLNCFTEGEGVYELTESLVFEGPHSCAH